MIRKPVLHIILQCSFKNPSYFITKRGWFQYFNILLENAYFSTRSESLVSFNPYSAGNCSGRTPQRAQVILRLFVTILVLLEITLEDFKCRFEIDIDSSFNPCSAGNCSGRGQNPFSSNPERSFNPCSAGNCSGRTFTY